MPVRRIIFTDLDGTLLDVNTYRPSQTAIGSLKALEEAGILVVPASSKTGAEVRPLMAELGLSGPAVVEGGAVLVFDDGAQRLMGVPRADLVAKLDRLKTASWPLRGMAEMSVGEVVDLTGLSTGGARRAMTREASEPFILTKRMPAEKLDELSHAVGQLGASLVRGGRFWHLLGAGIGKGVGMEAIVDSVSSGDRPATAAIGDAWNDLSMLETADLAYLLGDAVAIADTPAGVVRIAASGPEGFSQAVQLIHDQWR